MVCLSGVPRSQRQRSWAIAAHVLIGGLINSGASSHLEGLEINRDKPLVRFHAVVIAVHFAHKDRVVHRLANIDDCRVVVVSMVYVSRVSQYYRCVRDSFGVGVRIRIRVGVGVGVGAGVGVGSEPYQPELSTL